METDPQPASQGRSWPPPRIRVLIVEDHPVVRRGLCGAIAAEPDMDVCGQTADTIEALQLVDSARPQVVVVDLFLKSGHGIDLIEQIKAGHSDAAMLVSSMQDEAIFAERALRAGALGYVSKLEPIEHLVDAIRRVARGEVCVSPAIANALLQKMVAGEPSDPASVRDLSNRELEVFDMIGHGMSTKQIAKRLDLSPKTIDTYRDSIKKKLNLANANQLSRRAVQWVLEHH
ncbi:MAG: response regulator transcription factor [Thermoguttaceae bacterium]|jgi:DNA-binding NarL/FixJ family response regulator